MDFFDYYRLLRQKYLFTRNSYEFGMNFVQKLCETSTKFVQVLCKFHKTIPSGDSQECLSCSTRS